MAGHPGEALTRRVANVLGREGGAHSVESLSYAARSILSSHIALSSRSTGPTAHPTMELPVSRYGIGSTTWGECVSPESRGHSRMWS